MGKMKIILKSASLVLLLIISTAKISAQDQVQADQPRGVQNMKPILTEDQRAMLKNDLQKRKELRDAFKATLTQQQKDMLTDPRLVKADRIKAFRASLTDQQVNLIKARQKEVKTSRSQFRATLTDKQKMQFRRMAMNKGRMNHAMLIRARLRHKIYGLRN